MRETSFDAARGVLSRVARRSFFGWRGLWLLALWGALAGGGVISAVGWAFDAFHGQFTGGMHSHTMGIFGAHAIFVFLYVLSIGGPLTPGRDAFSWRSALNSNHGILLGHGITLVAVIMSGMHWAHFLACELVARGMHQDDLAESIRVFLAARDGHHGQESYEFSFD